MLIGHYSIPLLVKAWKPAIPVWLLLLAAQFLDLIWAPLVLLGIEKVNIGSGPSMADLLDLYYMPYSHSLIAAFFWSAVAYIGTHIWLGSRDRYAPLLVAVIVMSHWLLDFLVHPGDLPLVGDAHKVGLGLWHHTAISMTLEIGTVAAALWLWLRNSKPQKLALLLGGSFMVTLIATQFFVFFGPRFPVPVVAVLALMTYLSVATFGHLIETRLDHRT